MRYLVAGRIFDDKNRAIEHANFIFKVSGIIVAVEFYDAP